MCVKFRATSPLSQFCSRTFRTAPHTGFRKQDFRQTIHDSADSGKPGMRINYKIGKSCLFRHQFWQYSGKMASTQFEIIEVNNESSPQGLVNQGQQSGRNMRTRGKIPRVDSPRGRQFFPPALPSLRKTTCNTGVYSIDLIQMLVLWPHCIPRNLKRCDSLPCWKLKREYEHEYRIATFDRTVIK